MPVAPKLKGVPECSVAHHRGMQCVRRDVAFMPSWTGGPRVAPGARPGARGARFDRRCLSVRRHRHRTGTFQRRHRIRQRCQRRIWSLQASNTPLPLPPQPMIRFPAARVGGKHGREVMRLVAARSSKGTKTQKKQNATSTTAAPAESDWSASLKDLPSRLPKPGSQAFWLLLLLGLVAVKVVRGRGLRGATAVSEPRSKVRTKEQEEALHVYRCGGCGYTLYPALGRELKFFPETFKCPMCGAPKSEFWDVNDPDDPRNQEEEEEEEEEEQQQANTGQQEPQSDSPSSASEDSGGPSA